MSDPMKPIPSRRNVSRDYRRLTAPIPADAAEAEPVAERVFVMPEATLPDPPSPAAAATAPEPEPAPPPRKLPTLTIAAQIDGFPVTVSFEGRLAQLPDALAKLRAIGATPPSAPTPTPAPIGQPDELPDGWRWCAKHGAPMKPRQKQGDTWHSHNMGTAEHPIWCKGWRGPDSPGYEIE